ncbi:condensation domain-containing protein [Amycolatopsis samaneae]|uniref:Condensation domain-containing protein n=1 Tax=Amycolatopsis samaneae TaxID=664691 RepID=A0ABW5GPC0_9PSEU
MTAALSAAQEMLWLLYRLAPESRAYHVVLPVRVRTPLDRAALERAVAALPVRHELLRSAYRERAGCPFRTVLEVSPVRLRVVDAPAARIAELVAETSGEPFRLEAGETFRVVLIRLAEADAVLVVTAHHIGCDATSIWLLLRDLLAVYAGVPPRPLPYPPGAQIEAERALLASPRRAGLESHWRAECAGAVAAALPTDRPRPATRAFRGASLVVRFGGPQSVRATAHALKVTPFSLLLGTFEALMRRYTGLDELVIGCPASTRTSARLRDTVGSLVNTLVLRSAFDATSTFAEAALSARDQLRSALSHVEFPLSLLTGTPGFPAPKVAFTALVTDRLEPPLPMVPAGADEGPEVRWYGLRLALVDAPHMEGQFDVNAEVRLGREAMSVVFRYDVALFDEPTIRTFADRYLRLLRIAVAEPRTRVDSVSLAEDVELGEVLAFGAARRIEPL